ncbi:cullin-4B [Nephila pilipes]|uniref:Cullin-4B n=1 Tax=Nephila pilipes TaxID=299642 RepID=A0A8X6T734_NEPPI|nr:cullin-4B [Nephila pilipes]
MIDSWRLQEKGMAEVRNIFMMLDQVSHLRPFGTLDLKNLSINSFRCFVMGNTNIFKSTVDRLLDIIEKERNGELTNRTLTKSILRMLTELKVYRGGFQNKFLQVTENYYEFESRILLREMELSVYIQHIVNRIREEEGRLLYCTDLSSMSCLIKKLQEVLVINPIHHIFQKGVEEFLNKKTDGLIGLFELFYDVNQHEALCFFFESYVKKKVSVIVNDPNIDERMIEDLLSFSQNMYSIVADCFKNHTMFNESLSKIFESAVKRDSSRPAKLLGQYLDTKLCFCSSQRNYEDLQDLLKRIIFLMNKEVLEMMYWRRLAARLLLSSNTNFNDEKAKLSTLKKEWGSSSYICKMEEMFKDMEVSELLMLKYEQRFPDFDDPYEVSFSILTGGVWPMFPVRDITLPESISGYEDDIQVLYEQSTLGRRLSFQHYLSSCVLKGFFSNGEKELQVSLHQAVILLLFNAKDRYSFVDILLKTKIDAEELRKNLKILSMENNILRKVPQSEFKDTDSFIFNKYFSTELSRVELNGNQITEVINKETVEMPKNRPFLVTRTIFRIMKMNRTMKHEDLLTRVYEEIQFDMPRLEVEKGIKNLMYIHTIRKDPQYPDLYHYIT